MIDKNGKEVSLINVKGLKRVWNLYAKEELKKGNTGVLLISFEALRVFKEEFDVLIEKIIKDSVKNAMHNKLYGSDVIKTFEKWHLEKIKSKGVKIYVESD